MGKDVRRRVIVAGGRDFSDECAMDEVFCRLILDNDIIVSGCCPTGADSLSREYAQRHGLAVEEFPADWDAHGKAAGPIRNQAMAWKADVLIAFWDGKSRGTKDMIERMARGKKELHIYFY